MVLRVAVWVVALVACLGNLLVLVGRLVLREPNAVHSFYIKNLALADLIMGVYLFVIASHDVAFRGEYIRYDYRWRRSVGCSVSGFLSTVRTPFDFQSIDSIIKRVYQFYCDSDHMNSLDKFLPSPLASPSCPV